MRGFDRLTTGEHLCRRPVDAACLTAAIAAVQHESYAEAERPLVGLLVAAGLGPVLELAGLEGEALAAGAAAAAPLTGAVRETAVPMSAPAPTPAPGEDCDPPRPGRPTPLPFALSPEPSVRDACLLLAECLYMNGAFDVCLRLCEGAAREGALDAAEPHAELLRGWILHRRGRAAQALDLATSALRRGRHGRRSQRLGRAGQAAFLHLRGTCHHNLGRKELARRDLDNAIALFRLAGNRAGETEALITLGAIEAATGRLPDAEGLFRAAIAQNARIGSPFRRARGLHVLGVVLYKSGRPAAALPLLEEAEAVEAGRSREQDLLQVRLARTRALLMLGRRAEARALAMPALSEAARSRLPREEVLALETAGDVVLADGRPAAACRYFERALELARRPGMRADLEAGLLRRLGEATLPADPARAVELLRPALRAARGSGERFEEAIARRLLARALAGLEQWRRAHAEARAAAALAREFGAELELARALLEAARIRLAWAERERAGGALAEAVPWWADAAVQGATAAATVPAAPATTEELLAAGPLLGCDARSPVDEALLCPAGHLESAWSSVIEAFHVFAALDWEQGCRECIEVMDRLRSAGPGAFLAGGGKAAVAEPAAAAASAAGAAIPAPPAGHADGDPAARLRRALAANPCVARSPAMRQVLQLAAVAACSREPILITGETGTGKELIARIVHAASDRAGRPFVAVNCAAVPETLFEREFFGHRKGTFTGADADKPGYCEQAAGGTLLLDEVGDMPPSLQVKLLRLLQEGCYRRLGDPEERRADLRVIAATNADLPTLIAERRFRRDLYYRVRILEIELPPLRERSEDLEPLFALFVERAARPGVRPSDLFEPGVLEALGRYGWPGNVRELEAITRRLTLLAGHAGRGTVRMLPPEIARWREDPAGGAGGGGAADGTGGLLDLARWLERAERERISEALTFCEGNRTEAARALGISRNTLYKKMERLGIRIPA